MTEFTYRGKTLEELKKMNLKEFANMVPARQRRTLLRGLNPEQEKLVKKAEKSGESKVIKQLEGNSRFLAICWTPDSKHLVYQTMPFSLSILSIESGESKKLELNVPTLFNLRIHPDGKQVVFEAGRRIFEVWAMENFLTE